MDSKEVEVLIGIGFTVLDEVLAMIKHVKGQASLSTDQIVAMADSQDLKNKEDIKALLAL